MALFRLSSPIGPLRTCHAFHGSNIGGEGARICILLNEAASPPVRESKPASLDIKIAAMGDHDELAGDFATFNDSDRFQEDHWIIYSRLRFSERENYLANLRNSSERDRIIRELQRIESLRSSFVSIGENAVLMWKHDLCRAQWKNDAFRSREDNLYYLEDRIEDMHLEPEAESKRRLRWEERILRDVGKWKQVPYPPKPKEPKEEAVHDEEEPRDGETPKSKKRFRGLFTRGKATESYRPRPKKKKRLPKSPKEERPRPADSYQLTVTQVTLEKWTSTASFEQFQVERYPLNDFLFAEGLNPLSKTSRGDTIRYFHLPANNMHWIEEAIGRYYGEETPGDYNHRRAPNYLQRSSKLLCHEHWTSLQHGGAHDPSRARYMAPHCSRIISKLEDDYDDEKINSNFVIFMPYLHWESYDRQSKMSEITKKVARNHLQASRYSSEYNTLQFLGLIDQIKSKQSDSPTEVNTSKPERDGVRRPLGRYLIAIANLYAAMDIEPDFRALRDHLFHDPPLHPRRTLFQSLYYSKLDGDSRDKRQVIYRGTSSGRALAQRACLVMVDQLWLYVLDGNTIISAFPRRITGSVQEKSDVHSMILKRLDQLEPGQIQKVYDLALMIIDECSSSFLKRPEAEDERPPVVNIFSNTLGFLTETKNSAFDTFWGTLRSINPENRPHIEVKTEPYILREANDISEEITIIDRIYDQQRRVVDDFAKYLSMNDPKANKTPFESEVLSAIQEIRNKLSVVDNLRVSTRLQGEDHTQTIPQTTTEDRTLKTGVHVPDSTLRNAKQTIESILQRKGQVQELQRTALEISDQLRDLITLKNQQASVMEAQYASQLGSLSFQQNRSIMVFTIVTIVFLPLSFMSSVFGMNASDFDGPDGGNRMSLKAQFKLLFPISLGVIVISTALAFSARIRLVLTSICSIVWAAPEIAWAAFTEYTYLRQLWLFSTSYSKKLERRKRNKIRHIHLRVARMEARKEMERAMRVERGGDAEFELVRKKKKRAMLSPV